jgi:hypothetical protein
VRLWVCDQLAGWRMTAGLPAVPAKQRESMCASVVQCGWVSTAVLGSCMGWFNVHVGWRAVRGCCHTAEQQRRGSIHQLECVWSPV